jgi:hypothetical protein
MKLRTYEVRKQFLHGWQWRLLSLISLMIKLNQNKSLSLSTMKKLPLHTCVQAMITAEESALSLLEIVWKR